MTKSSQMKPINAYLLRAVREWMIDSGVTPEIVIDATTAGVELPQWLRGDQAVVLNVSDQATAGLALGNEWVSMRTRFNGASHTVRIPINAIRAVRARESGHLVPLAGPEDAGGETQAQTKPQRAALRVVK